MLKTITTTLICFFGLLIATSAAKTEEATLSIQQAREDLRFLFDTLQQEHIDLFARVSEVDYSKHIEDLIASIQSPMTLSKFGVVLQDAMAFGKIGHSKTDAILADVFAHIGAGGKIIPLSIAYHGEKMRLDQWADESDTLKPGSQILKLGGVSLPEFEEQLRSMIAADTDRLFRSQIELGMPAYIYLVFGPVDELEVTFIDGEDNAAKTHSISAMGYGEMFALQDARALPGPERDSYARVYRPLENEIAYIQPGAFFTLEEEKQNEDESYAIDAFKAFVEDAFRKVAQSNAKDLIIDLRDNPGGDASFSDLIIARLVDEPYRYASKYVVRAGANTKKIWAKRPLEPGTLSGQVGEAIAHAKAGALVEIDLQATQPISTDAFRGNAWALINKHSYSNAAVISALMQDLDIATIIGEETADLPTTYGAVEQFTLPHSGASITYPKAYMVRPSGSEEVRGVIPDVTLEPNPIGVEKDVMLDETVKHILEARKADS